MISARQHGLLTASQLVALGATRTEIAAQVRRGTWRRMFRGVVATEHARLSDPALRRRAALLVAGTDAVLSHRSALAEHGLGRFEDEVIHVAVPHTGTLPRPSGIVVHRRNAADPVVRRHGVPVEPAARAVMQTFPSLPHGDATSLVCEAVASGMVTPNLLRAAAARHRGAARMRHLLGLVELGCESPLEIDYLLHVERRFGLPTGIRQARVGPARVDVLYPHARVIVELDGTEFHADDARRRADIRRDAILAGLGYVTLRFPGSEVRRAPRWVAARVAETLALRTPR